MNEALVNVVYYEIFTSQSFTTIVCCMKCKTSDQGVVNSCGSDVVLVPFNGCSEVMEIDRGWLR